jgi:hypothetical protein
MDSKKIILKIRREDTSCVYGILTQNVLDEVCVKTGLNQEQVLASIERLEKLGILDKEVATIH